MNGGFQFLKSLLRTTSCLCILFPSRTIFSFLFFNILTKTFRRLLILLFNLQNEAFLFAFFIHHFQSCLPQHLHRELSKRTSARIFLKMNKFRIPKIEPWSQSGGLRNVSLLSEAVVVERPLVSTYSHPSGPTSNTLSSREMPGSFIFPRRLVACGGVIIWSILISLF